MTPLSQATCARIAELEKTTMRPPLFAQEMADELQSQIWSIEMGDPPYDNSVTRSLAKQFLLPHTKEQLKNLRNSIELYRLLDLRRGGVRGFTS